MPPCHIKPKKTTKRKKSPKKKSVIQILCVPKIVATMPIRALVADSTSVQLMEPRTEVFAPTDYIGMTKKSKTFRNVGTRVPSPQRDRRRRALLQHQNFDSLFYLVWSVCFTQSKHIIMKVVQS